MTNEDLVGGLKSALERGESLEQAMMSFYNAGYKKEDIEWAASSLQMRGPSQPVQKKIPGAPSGAPLAGPTQKVSEYRQKPAVPGQKIGITALIIILVILLALIVSILFFRKEMISLFNSIMDFF